MHFFKRSIAFFTSFHTTKYDCEQFSVNILLSTLSNKDNIKILTNPTDIIGTLDNTIITVIVLFFIIVASASTNLIANYVPAQNSLLNFFKF